jgi:hypothetical protein
MPVTSAYPLMIRHDSAPRSLGTALALYSVLGGAVVAGLAMLLMPRPVADRPLLPVTGGSSEVNSYALAEDAIQRTLECRSF